MNSSRDHEAPMNTRTTIMNQFPPNMTTASRCTMNIASGDFHNAAERSANRLALGALLAGLILGVGSAEAKDYFVNDTSVSGDVYASAPGSSSGSGTNAASPMDSIQRVLDSFDLDGGDTIYIDTGAYVNQAVSIGADDSGAPDNPMTIQGSTNMAAGGTMMTASGGNALYLNGVVNVRARALRLRNSVRGVYIYNSSGIELEDVWVATTTVSTVIWWNYPYATMRGCVAAWNGSYGLYAYYHSTIWENGVLWENRLRGLGELSDDDSE